MEALRRHFSDKERAINTAISLAESIRRCTKKAHKLLSVTDENSQLIDLIHHIDGLAQQIESLNTPPTEGDE